MDNKKFSGIFTPRASFYLWIIFILVVLIGIWNIWIAIPGYLLLLFLVYYNYRTNYVRRHEITKYIENLTFNIDAATKDTLLNFPMPLVLLELDGTIIWYNSSFRRIFEGEDLLDRAIHGFIADLNPENLVNEKASFSKEIEIKGKYYTVLGNYAKTEGKAVTGGYILMLYLIDNTALHELKDRYENERACVSLIVIDNYDDLMQSMEDAKRPQMLAEIDKEINSWLSFAEGIFKKYERDRYIFLFSYQYLKKFEEKKFEILDAIKEINIGNKIPVTLSLGFGINGNTLLENFHNASASIDIALGRGGDHVVIRDREQFRFFGGKTRELEKRTKVKARVMAYAIRELIDKADQVLIMGHENSDIDALGAALGIFRIVKNRGRDAFVVLNRSNPAIDRIIDKINQNPDYTHLFLNRNEALERMDKTTLLVIVDTHRPKYTECPELLAVPGRQVVVIDHHRKGADFIQDAVLTYQETYASSTCELVTEILQYVDDRIKLTQLEIEALYAGILVDTKSFTFKTGVRTFEAASFLRRHGVDTVAVKQLFRYDLDSYVAVSDVVKAAEIIDNKIAISLCPTNIKKPQMIAAQAADELLNLMGISAAFVMGSLEDEIFISGRSLGEINVQMILEKLGGGGHHSVAGAQIQGTGIEDAKQKLKYAIMEYMEESNEG